MNRPEYTNGVSLLGMCSAGGCASKLPKQQLDQILSALGAKSVDPSVVDDFGDAALTRMPDSEDLLVTTIDFGTPICDDPFTWGLIAINNAVSDVYAVGGKPSLAMGILGWPTSDDLEMRTALSSLMSGAARGSSDHSMSLVGGHSFASIVPFFGAAVIGVASSARYMSSREGQAGHYLGLTKPLGTGLAIAGRKSGVVEDDTWREVTEVMMETNRVASQLALDVGIRAATDVSGFGLIGHVHTLARRSGQGAEIWTEEIPRLEALSVVFGSGVVSSFGERNMLDTESYVDFGETAPADRLLLCDPQTSGGLVLAGSEKMLREVSRRLDGQVWIIGRLVSDEPGRVRCISRAGG